MSERSVLRRAQVLTIVLGGVGAAALALAGRPQLGLGLGIGSLWAALNLRVLEGLLRAAIVPRDATRSVLRISIWFLLKMSVYVVAIWLLIVAPFPVVGMAHGLTVMVIALVLAGSSSLSASGRNAANDNERVPKR